MILFINVYLDFNGSSPLQMPYDRMNLSEFGKDEVLLVVGNIFKIVMRMKEYIHSTQKQKKLK